MSIEQRKVETFEERLYCDECGCEMKHTGIFLACNPPLYPHKCIVCGHFCLWPINATHPHEGPDGFFDNVELVGGVVLSNSHGMNLDGGAGS